MNPRAQRILQKNEKLRDRIERSKKEYRTLGGETRFVWAPEQDRIERVIVKNARGHGFFEYGEPMLDAPTRVGLMPLESLSPAERTQFDVIPSNGLLSEVGSRMLTRAMTGQDLVGSWVVVQEGVYRYGVWPNAAGASSLGL